MDVQVGTVDIHAIQLPATATYVNAVLVCACKLSWRKPGQDLLHRGADGALLPDALTESAKRVQWLALQLEAARRGLHRQRPRSHCPLSWSQLATRFLPAKSVETAIKFWAG